MYVTRKNKKRADYGDRTSLVFICNRALHLYKRALCLHYREDSGLGTFAPNFCSELWLNFWSLSIQVLQTMNAHKHTHLCHSGEAAGGSHKMDGGYLSTLALLTLAISWTAMDGGYLSTKEFAKPPYGTHRLFKGPFSKSSPSSSFCLSLPYNKFYHDIQVCIHRNSIETWLQSKNLQKL